MERVMTIHGLRKKSGPVISNPEFVGNDPYTAVDTAGFFCVRYNVAKAVDAGITEAASGAVTKIVNAYDKKSPPVRWHETQGAYRLVGDQI